MAVRRSRGSSGTRALAVVAFDGAEPQPDLTHAWFPRPAFDETALADHAALARSGDGLAALFADGPLTPITTGPSAGCELRLPGRRGRWLLRLGDTAAHGGLPDFRRRYAGLALAETADGRMIVDDPDYGVVEFARTGKSPPKAGPWTPPLGRSQGREPSFDENFRGEEHR